MNCFLASDLHGCSEKYSRLFERILAEKPKAVFLAGDLLPGGVLFGTSPGDFLEDVLFAGLRKIREQGDSVVFLILGNDDPAIYEQDMLVGEKWGLFHYSHMRKFSFSSYKLFGYSNVPPTPFRLKDWERYDVSRYVDVGCVSPEEGWRTVQVNPYELRIRTIKKDLDDLMGRGDHHNSILIAHSPPYKTALDHAGISHKMVDYAPMDDHVGSVAIRQFIEDHQPLLTMHGHIHDSYVRTGAWKDRIGRTVMINAAHEGPELSLIRINLADPWNAEKELI